MTLRERTVEEQAQLYNLTNFQEEKLMQVLKEHYLGLIGNFHIKEVNKYGTQFVNIEELPYISCSNEKSNHVTMYHIGEGDYIKDTHKLEIGTIEFIGKYYKFTYVHRQGEDNNFVLHDSNNGCYCFRTMSAMFERVRSLAVAESIGLVVTSNNLNSQRYYIDGDTPKE